MSRSRWRAHFALNGYKWLRRTLDLAWHERFLRRVQMMHTCSQFRLATYDLWDKPKRPHSPYR